MSVDMVCELQDGICHLCGKDPHEDCPLIGLETEVAEWAERSPAHEAIASIINLASQLGEGFYKVIDTGLVPACTIASCNRHQQCMYFPCRHPLKYGLTPPYPVS